MTNPSTIWAQLASPNSAVGSCPYVTGDGITITADVSNYYYIDSTWNVLAGSQLWQQLTVLNGLRVGYADTSGAPATAVTINKSAGRFSIPAGQTSVVVTCNACFATSLVQCQLEFADATLTRVTVVPAAGSFTVTGNAAATAATKLNFSLTNVF